MAFNDHNGSKTTANDNNELEMDASSEKMQSADDNVSESHSESALCLLDDGDALHGPLDLINIKSILKVTQFKQF